MAGGLALLTGVALAGAPAAGAAAAGAAASNQILNWNSDLCLGINGGGGEWGRTAIQWDCNGNPDQKWNFWASSGSYSTVKNENGLCLGIRNASTDLGAEALQWQCNGNDDQKWSITPAPGGGYRFVNKHSGFCLGIWGGHTNQVSAPSSGRATETPTRPGTSARPCLLDQGGSRPGPGMIRKTRP
ncbi:hypothetical protein ADK94_35555 [Streptomyces sp. XY593]|nr:hypothetical protein ADK94_35555 [Streptomyces sp. XY593]